MANVISVSQSYRKKAVLFILDDGDARLIQQAVDLFLDPGAGIRRDRAQRLPLRFREVYRKESAGVLAHGPEITAPFAITKTELNDGPHQFLE